MSISRVKYLLTISVLVLFYPVCGQADSSLKKNSFKGFPAAFYTPETRIGVGGIAVYSFYMKRDSTQQFASSITLGTAFTQEKQILLFVPFNLYFNQRTWWTYGEIGYYKYPFYFYGIGNTANADYREQYVSTAPRVRLSVMRRVSKKKFLFTGLKYAFDEMKIPKLDTSGILFKENIIGSRGGTISGFGWVNNLDTRNHNNYPTKGILAEFFIYHENTFTGSDYKYTRMTTDLSSFHSLTKKQVLGFNFYGTYILGDVPFTHLGQLGGSEKLRGYYEGRFRDKIAMTLQSEWRFNFYGRWGINAFAATGVVGSEPGTLAISNFKFSCGGGMRFALDKKQRINLRGDIAIGKNSSGVYCTLGEAF